MINAETFREKIKERKNKVQEEVELDIQNLLQKEIEKDNVIVPFMLELNELCTKNIDITLQILNILGFNGTLEKELHNEHAVVLLDFVKPVGVIIPNNIC